MTAKELYGKLDELIPKELSCVWDNDGLMCCPDGNREIKKVLVSLDVTAEAVNIAVEGGYDCIISHHPMIFKGLRSVTDSSPSGSKLIALIKNGISVMSFHTRLDCVDGGVNDTLCDLLTITDTEKIVEENLPLGRIGFLPHPISAKELAEHIKDKLGCPFVLLSDAGVAAHRVAVMGGSGSDAIKTARAMGADTFISGRLGYHEMTDGADLLTLGEGGINLIEAGHFYTEAPVCNTLCNMVQSIDPHIICTVHKATPIKAV